MPRHFPVLQSMRRVNAAKVAKGRRESVVFWLVAQQHWEQRMAARREENERKRLESQMKGQ